MGLGSTAKKLQKVVDVVDDLYTKLQELREQIVEMRGTIGETHDRVDAMEDELTEQRALLEAIAEANDVALAEDGTPGGETDDEGAPESGDGAAATDDVTAETPTE